MDITEKNAGSPAKSCAYPKRSRKVETKEVTDGLKKWFRDLGWPVRMQNIDGDMAFYTKIAAKYKNLLKGYDATFVCRKDVVQLYLFPPVSIGDKYLSDVERYLCRVNRLLRFGKFTVDYDAMEIQWEYTKDIASMEVLGIRGVIEELIGFSRYICDRYADGVLKIQMGMTPSQVLEEGFRKDESKVRRKRVSRKSIAVKSGAVLPKGYSLEGLNIVSGIRLSEIVEAVRRFRADDICPDIDMPRISILLSGPPGSGKTAYARHLAQETGAPLMVVKGSDVLCRYQGETESRIAEKFAEAEKAHAILFFDEIDGLLRNREKSERMWEVTQVNELLQQIEGFRGVMIAATNIPDSMDKAVIRRFTYKLTFDYLSESGKMLFYSRYFGTPLNDAEKVRLAAIPCLCPGDYRTVMEGLYYLDGKQSNEARLEALEREAVAKERAIHARIGF